MNGLMNFLVRAKLVELSEDERQAPADSALAPQASVEMPPEPEPPPLPPPVPLTDLDIAEGKAFDEIFAAAAIPPSAFPAEKLLRLLDGLRAMDGTTRKTAVLAMDAADDSWQIVDSVADAQRKIAALASYKQVLAAQLQGSEQVAAAKSGDIRADLESATAAIRQQIAELEQLLERKITQSAQETTNIEANLRATREAVAREVRRMDGEIERLREIPSQFSAADPTQAAAQPRSVT